jgi:hypothetical protein
VCSITLAYVWWKYYFSLKLVDFIKFIRQIVLHGTQLWCWANAMVFPSNLIFKLCNSLSYRYPCPLFFPITNPCNILAIDFSLLFFFLFLLLMEFIYTIILWKWRILLMLIFMNGTQYFIDGNFYFRLSL